MTVTPPRAPLRISLDPETLAEFRRRTANPCDVTYVELEALARPLLGPRWIQELCALLGPFKPATVGGMRSKKNKAHPLHRTSILKWKVADVVPPWVSPYLPRLPELALARHRARLAEAEAEVVEWRREMAEVEEGLEDALREAVRAALPRYWSPSERLPPPPRDHVDPKRKWRAVSQEEVEAAEDAGSLSAGVAQGGEDDPIPRPEHPALADAWDRGWIESFDDLLARYDDVMAREERRSLR